MSTTGIAWYKKEQWPEFRRIARDIEETYEEWEKNADRLCARMKKKGVLVKKVPIDITELALWCRSTKQACNAPARADYVALKLKEMISKKA